MIIPAECQAPFCLLSCEFVSIFQVETIPETFGYVCVKEDKVGFKDDKQKRRAFVVVVVDARHDY